MTKQALFNFIVEKDTKSITVERSFNAPLDPVWAAWTEADILCKWWAPKPYECVIKSMEFREGGRCHYCMAGPQGDRHWAYFDYKTIRPKSYFDGHDGFCDEEGTINTAMPSTRWESHFGTSHDGTLVRCILHFTSTEHMDQMLQMGFKEGFTMGLDQLDQLLAGNKE